MEVSAERKSHCVGRAGEECSSCFSYIVNYVRIMVLQRSSNVFLTPVASWNTGGCVASSALHELMMSCGYIVQVVVVTRIIKSVKFV